MVVEYQVERIRSGGVTMSFVVRDPDGERIFCDGKRTVCKISAQSHQPTPWTEPFRNALEAYL